MEGLQHIIHDGDNEEWKHFVEMKQKKTMMLFNLSRPCFEYVGRLDLLRDYWWNWRRRKREWRKKKEKEKERNDDERKGIEEQEGKRKRKMIGLTGGSVMTGMGGAGKTETAILVGNLLYWYFRGNVRMMRAENEMRLWESTLSLGKDLDLKLEENEPKENFIVRVYKELGCLERFLLIFDNGISIFFISFIYLFFWFFEEIERGWWWWWKWRIQTEKRNENMGQRSIEVIVEDFIVWIWEIGCLGNLERSSEWNGDKSQTSCVHFMKWWKIWEWKWTQDVWLLKRTNKKWEMNMKSRMKMRRRMWLERKYWSHVVMFWKDLEEKKNGFLANGNYKWTLGNFELPKLHLDRALHLWKVFWNWSCFNCKDSHKSCNHISITWRFWIGKTFWKSFLHCREVFYINHVEVENAFTFFIQKITKLK
jgi:hypothetical protein